MSVRVLPLDGTVIRCDCGGQFRFYETLKGKQMPINVDANPVDVTLTLDGREILHFDRKDTHWATCPKAKEFKRR
jgi:hypothetical protein